LAGLGLLLVADLLRHYPRDYLDYANLVRIAALEPGRTATVVGTVRRSHAFASPRNPNLSILEIHLHDVTGRLQVSRFFAGRRFTTPAWLKSQQRLFPPGATVAVSGLVKESPYGPAFSDPLMEVLESAGAPVRSEAIGRLLPVYSLTEGLTADSLRKAIQTLLPSLEDWSDPLPEALRQRLGLLPLNKALQAIHQPTDQAALQASRRRLVFDEFLLLQLSLAQRRHQLRQRPALPLDPLPGGLELVSQLRSILPFPLTGAQERVLAEIRHDLRRPQPMARFPYLRPGGTAAFHREHWAGLAAELRPTLLLVGSLVGLSVVGGWPLAGLAGLLPALLVPLWLGRRLGGHSGDSYGACVEWAETLALLVAAVPTAAMAHRLALNALTL
jgi:ATP-dependent DNA helicase RecG